MLFIKELLKSFTYVEMKEVEKAFTPAEKKVMRSMKQSMEEIKRHEKGKGKLKSLDELLNEL